MSGSSSQSEVLEKSGSGGSRSRSSSVRSSKRGSGEWNVRGSWILDAFQVSMDDDAGSESEDDPPLGPVTPRPPAMQLAVEKKLMTFDTLAQKIGHQPHRDVTMKVPLKGVVTVKKKSVAYKSMQREMGEAFRQIGDVGAIGLDGLTDDTRADLEKSITDQLATLKTAAQQYRAKHSKNRTKRGVADELVQSIDDYAAMLKDGLDKVMADPAFDKVKGHIDIKQALHAKTCGIAFADCDFDKFNTANEDEVDEEFGSGMANKVAKIKYDDGTERVFKPERATEDKPLSIAGDIGIDSKQVHNGNRNIASLAIADLIGSSTMPKVSYGLHKNPDSGETTIGLCMSVAPGKTPTYTKDDGTNAYRELWPPGNPPSATAIKKLQEQCAELDWCDVITGQSDRHGKNYLVDINGDDVTVTGIDNDVCFGTKQDNADANKASNFSRTSPPGLPLLIPKKVYDQLVGSDFDRDLLPKMGSLLSPREIDGARARFNQVKQHAATLHPDYVVTDYGTWVSPPSTTWKFKPNPPDLYPAGTDSKKFLKAMAFPGMAPVSGGLFGRDLAGLLQADGAL